MVKKKQNRIFDPSTMIRKASFWYNTRGVVTIVLWLMFAASVCVKLLLGKGLIASIPCVIVAHGTLLAPAPLLELAKTLGVCSLFIAWIYAELGKSELGRRYTELLSDLYKHYHLRALSYILAILACLYIATAGILESAGIAMLIAVLGLWDQARVLVGFIFTPAVRKELAVMQWDRLFSVKQSPKGPFIKTTLSDLYVLADNIAVEDEYLDKLCRNMAKGILSYINKGRLSLLDSKDSIITISHVWERLLGSRPDHEQLLILHHVLSHIEDYLKTDLLVKEKRIFVCAGYLYWQLRYCTKPVVPGTAELGDDLLRIMSDLDLLHQKLHNTQEDLINCLNMLYASFWWMFFLCNKINLNQEMLEFLVSYQRSYDNSCKDCVRLFVCCTFNEDTCKTYFDTAWNQVRKP